MTVPQSLRTLRSAIAAQIGVSAPSDPPYVRDSGQTLEDWLAAVAAARRAHDAFALLRQRVRDGLTGAGVSPAAQFELPAEGDLVRSSRSFEVATGLQLADIVPALAARVPRGPLAQSPEETSTVRLRMIGPREQHGSRSARPGILRFHGGAFWMGGGETSAVLDRDLDRYLVQRTGAVVINVDYRLAPEHPFPAAIVDALLALDLVRGESVTLGIDPARLALLGTSSGGNTATVAAIADAARASAPPLAALGLIVPSLNLSTAPAELLHDPAAWSTRIRQVSAYVGDAVQLESPWVSPALFEHLPAMPPTFAVLAQHDEIAQGGEALCAAITAGGGTASARQYSMTHTLCLPEVEAASLQDLGDFLVGVFRRH